MRTKNFPKLRSLGFIKLKRRADTTSLCECLLDPQTWGLSPPPLALPDLCERRLALWIMETRQFKETADYFCKFYLRTFSISTLIYLECEQFTLRVICVNYKRIRYKLDVQSGKIGQVRRLYPHNARVMTYWPLKGFWPSKSHTAFDGPAHRSYVIKDSYLMRRSPGTLSLCVCRLMTWAKKSYSLI